jgi:hypothetical protein
MRILPTFSAPGGAIFSSVPGNNFATFQGGAMLSCPAPRLELLAATGRAALSPAMII